MKNFQFVAVVNGQKRHFELNAKSWETRHSWGHEAGLWVDRDYVAYKSVRYYNRTWEFFQYESVCQEALAAWADQLGQTMLEEARAKLGKCRLTKDERAKALRPVDRLKKRLFDHLTKANKKRW